MDERLKIVTYHPRTGIARNIIDTELQEMNWHPDRSEKALNAAVGLAR